MNNLVENNDWEFEWDFCHERLQSKRYLILRKLVHTEKVKFCVYFSLGKSDYGEECWISHDLSCKKFVTEIKCNLCEAQKKKKTLQKCYNL